METVAAIRVVRNEELEAGPDTAGVIRHQAYAAENLWVGEARTDAGMASGWHHHGEHLTVGRVLAGAIRIESGAEHGETFEAGPGDYFVVPPHLVHRESNPAPGQSLVLLVRGGSGPTVFNVEGPHSA